MCNLRWSLIQKLAARNTLVAAMGLGRVKTVFGVMAGAGRNGDAS
jgi:hypothetical protein